jgi:hypothetical protein
MQIIETLENRKDAVKVSELSKALERDPEAYLQDTGCGADSGCILGKSRT